ncbi:type II toxin-antitoxin system antitoxin SocA domain-containing protein [Barnesiella intestinihominis]|uniref:type II toxin-antitoxin system antitoxin SocA domain-containing protein n=1 Tax=Barnesiella intestinihominis TaxID=487174 RepID=UPI0035642E67
MKSPFTGGETILLCETRKAIFRKEEYEYTYLCYQCVDTKETFTTTQIDTVNTEQIYNSYRSAHGIPYPDEIKEIRGHYALSALKMSRILGFGDNQYRLYENGEIPNVANGRVLKAIQSPKTFETFVDAAKNILSDEEYAKIKKRIEEYESRSCMDWLISELIYGEYGRGKYNGYAKLSVSKLKNVLLFYIEKFDGVFVTLMNKLLFYTDFLAYRENGQAMTGLSFKAIQYGPVPYMWDRVYSLIDDISQIEVGNKNGYIGNKLVSEMPCDISSFTSEQLAVLEKVYETFKNDTSTSISKKSHDELAWIDNNKTRSLIDFKYAFSLKAI